MSIRELSSYSGDKLMRNRIIVVFLVMALALGLIAILVLFWMDGQNKNTVTIEGFKDCAKDLRSEDKKRLNETLISALNKNVAEAAKRDRFKGVVRGGTCKTADLEFSGQPYTTVSVLIDFEEVHKSRRISFKYIKSSVEAKLESFDAGPVEVNCPEQDELIYQDDSCSDTKEYPRDDDPIYNAPAAIEDLPGCYMQKLYSASAKSGYNIVIHYDPGAYASATEIAENRVKCRAAIEQSLVDSGVNLEDYNIYMKK